MRGTPHFSPLMSPRSAADLVKLLLGELDVLFLAGLQQGISRSFRTNSCYLSGVVGIVANAFAIFNPNILAINVSKFDQAFFEYVKPIEPPRTAISSRRFSWPNCMPLPLARNSQHNELATISQGLRQFEPAGREESWTNTVWASPDIGSQSSLRVSPGRAHVGDHLLPCLPLMRRRRAKSASVMGIGGRASFTSTGGCGAAAGADGVFHASCNSAHICHNASALRSSPAASMQ